MKKTNTKIELKKVENGRYEGEHLGLRYRVHKFQYVPDQCSAYKTVWYTEVLEGKWRAYEQHSSLKACKRGIELRHPVSVAEGKRRMK